MYPIRFTDADGKTVEGVKKYMIKFKQIPPVDVFCSITMYNADNKMLVEIEINRYKVGTIKLCNRPHVQ